MTKQATPPHPGLLVQQNWSFLQKPWEPGHRETGQNANCESNRVPAEQAEPRSATWE